LDTFLDNDVSGTLYPEDRPAMSKMWSRLDEVDCILVLDASRTNRNTGVAEYILRTLVDKGIDLLGAGERIDIQSPQGRMIFKIMNVVNENSVSVSREKSISSLQDMARKGELALNPFTYGFESIGKNKVSKIDSEISVVKKIFDLCLKGMSTTQISSFLNDRGYTTRNGCKWRARTIWSIIRNPRFKGKIYLPKPLPEGVKRKRIDRDRCIYDSPFPVVIPEKTWELTQIALSSRSKGAVASRSHNLLSGVFKCFYCGCGYGFQKRINKQSTYFCLGKRVKRSCSSIAIHSSADDLFDNFFSLALMKDMIVSGKKDNEVSKLLLEQDSLHKKISQIEANVLQDPDSAKLLMKVHSNAEKRLEELNIELSSHKAELVHGTADSQKRKMYNSLSNKDKNLMLKQDAEILVIDEWFIVSLNKQEDTFTHIGKFVKKVTYKSKNDKNMKAWVPVFRPSEFDSGIPEKVLAIFSKK
jgi:site-specific DNA recombinase